MYDEKQKIVETIGQIEDEIDKCEKHDGETSPLIGVKVEMFNAANGQFWYDAFAAETADKMVNISWKMNHIARKLEKCPNIANAEIEVKQALGENHARYADIAEIWYNANRTDYMEPVGKFIKDLKRWSVEIDRIVSIL